VALEGTHLEFEPESRSRIAAPGVEVAPARDHIVQGYFQSAAGYWKKVYRDDDLSARIYQERLLAALSWIDDLHLPPDSFVMDVGCGAGVATVALAERGYCVSAVDLAPAMLDLTTALAKQHGVEDRVQSQLAPAGKLPFESGTYACVIALGLLPWVEHPLATIAEMARMVRPGGYLLITADNYWRLDHFFDPMRNPLLRPVRRAVSSLLRLTRHRRTGQATAHTHRASEVEGCTTGLGFLTLKKATMGFGPFSFCTVPVFSEALSARAHDKLQKWADLGSWPWIHCGRQYLQLSRRPE
jgi:ubiquinone/menaquinone biosynthesis C-methylase UbiE